MGRHIATLAGYDNISELYIHENKISRITTGKSVLIFDDVDILCSYDRNNDSGINTDEQRAQREIFDSMLKFLDSEEINDCIVVFTTNNPQNFDQALFRPGRIDHHITFDVLPFQNIQNFVQQWYHVENVSGMNKRNVTSAELIGLVKHNIDNYFKFVEEWNAM